MQYFFEDRKYKGLLAMAGWYGWRINRVGGDRRDETGERRECDARIVVQLAEDRRRESSSSSRRRRGGSWILPDYYTAYSVPMRAVCRWTQCSLDGPAVTEAGRQQVHKMSGLWGTDWPAIGEGGLRLEHLPAAAEGLERRLGR